MEPHKEQDMPICSEHPEITPVFVECRFANNIALVNMNNELIANIINCQKYVHKNKWSNSNPMHAITVISRLKRFCLR